MANIVVGSGIAGMTLALLLAKQGKKVTILEAKHQIAPLMHGFHRNGLFFDTGFHYAGGMQENGILHKWLEVLGLWKHIGDEILIPIKEEFHFKNSIHSFATNDSEIEKTIQEQFADSCENIDKLLYDFNSFRAMMREFISSSPFLNANQKNMPDYNALHEKSLSEILENFDFPEYLKQMLTARCQLLGIDPHSCSLKHYAVLSEPYFQSSTSVIGGGKTIREAFLKELALYDVEIQCNSIVEKLIVENKKIKALEVNRKGNKEIIPCTQCFFTAHPRNIEQITPKNVFRPAFLNRIKELEETPLSFMLFAQSSSNYLENKVIYILDEEEKNFFNPLEEENPVIYLSSGKEVDGRYPIIAIATIRIDKEKKDANYEEWKKEISEKLASYIKIRVPQFSDLEILDASTPHTMRDWVHGSTGSLYGISHECDELPLLPITKLEGFYLAGQNILLPGLLGSMVSSIVCLSLIYGYDEILQGFRTWKKDV